MVHKYPASGAARDRGAGQHSGAETVRSIGGGGVTVRTGTCIARGVPIFSWSHNLELCNRSKIFRGFP